MPEYQFPQKVSRVQSSGGNSGGNKGGGIGPHKGGRNSGSIYNSQGKVHTGYWRGLYQDVPFFYTPSDLSELQICKSIIWGNIYVIFIFK